MSSVNRARLVTKEFVAVTLATGAFFIYIGMFVPLLPRFIEDELGAGELGIGLSIAMFALAAILVRPVIARLIEAHGRRTVMIGGALIAALGGLLTATVDSLGPLLAMRGLAGIGEAALFVGAATLISDLAPRIGEPKRRATSQSPCSAGSGLGRSWASWYSETTATTWDSPSPPGSPCWQLSCRWPSPRIAPHRSARRVSSRSGLARYFHPAAVGPGLVLASGIAAFSVFSAFLPDHARAVGLAGSGGLFAAYSVVCLVLRVTGARLPERLGARRSVSIAFVTVALAFTGLALFPHVWALWASAVVIGVGMAFMYPSLMALTVNRVPEGERPAAISSFTMFFEIGTVAGGLALGTVAELTSKRAAFAACVLVCGVGLWLLRARVAPVVEVRDEPAGPVPIYVPVAGD